MSVRLAPYPEYKDSGVPWLGEIPSHWELNPGFSAFRQKYLKNTGMIEKTVLSLSYGRIVVKPAEKLHGLVPASFETYQIVDPGEIIIRPTDLQNDWNSLRVGIARDRGIITSAYLCLKTTDFVIADYEYLLLHAYDLKKIFYGMGSGLRQNLDFTDLKRMPVLIPPREEQSAIVAFLAHFDRRINRLIRAKRRMIELLNEQKQAVINQAVTRGLDPDARLKPSGIDWLGDVPEHWEIMKLKFLVDARGGMTPSKAEAHFWIGEIPWISPKDMKAREIRDSIDHISQEAVKQTGICLIEPPAVLIVVRGMILARTFPVAVTSVPVTINQDMKALRPKSPLNPWFLSYLLTGIQKQILNLTEEAGHGTQCLRTDSWANFSIPVPKYDEQQRIVQHLETELLIADHAVARANREIELLREYRTRLIADVVTGKLDVRGVELPAIDEEEITDDLDTDEDYEEDEENDIERLS